jgi:hypothetical protein
MPTQIQHEELLDTADVARLLKVAVNTVAAMRQRGSGPAYFKVGSGPNALVRYRAADVQSYIESRIRSQTPGVKRPKTT